MSLGFDREQRIAQKGDTVDINAYIFDANDNPVSEDDLLTVNFTIQRPDKTQAAKSVTAVTSPIVVERQSQAITTPGIGQQMVLGVLNDALYLFGQWHPTAGSVEPLSGVHRLKKGGVWETLTLGISQPTRFWSMQRFPALEYRGQIYIGSQDQGKLFRLKLNPDGSFNAIEEIMIGAGLEDAFPLAVMWGKLFVGTYGPSTNTGPSLYMWDGIDSHAAELLVDTHTLNGTWGELTGCTKHDGKLWVSFTGENGNGQIYTVDSNLTARQEYLSTELSRPVFEYNGRLLATLSSWVNTNPTASLWEYTGGNYVERLSTDSQWLPESSTTLVVGDQLLVWLFDTASVFVYKNGQVQEIIPPLQTRYVNSPVLWNNVVWWGAAGSSNTNPALLKLPVTTTTEIDYLTGEITGDGTGFLRSSETNEVGEYTVVAQFTLSDGSKKTVRADYEVKDPFEVAVPTDNQVVADAVWFKMEDCFDATDEGPWLRDMTLNRFDPDKIQGFIAEGMMDINLQHPPTHLTVHDFTIASPDGSRPNLPIATSATFLAVIRHLMRSYTEQPQPSGANVVWHDRRDYVQRWGQIYGVEADWFKRVLALYKRQFLHLGETSILVSSKAGRLLPAPMRSRNIGRGYW